MDDKYEYIPPSVYARSCKTDDKKPGPSQS